MARKPSPSDQHPRYLLRLPETLRVDLAQAAAASGRSLNAEIVTRLEASLKGAEVVAELQGRVEALEAQIEEMDTSYDKRVDKVEAQMWRLLEHAGLYDPNPD